MKEKSKKDVALIPVYALEDPEKGEKSKSVIIGFVPMMKKDDFSLSSTIEGIDHFSKGNCDCCVDVCRLPGGGACIHCHVT